VVARKANTSLFQTGSRTNSGAYAGSLNG